MIRMGPFTLFLLPACRPFTIAVFGNSLGLARPNNQIPRRSGAHRSGILPITGVIWRP